MKEIFHAFFHQKSPINQASIKVVPRSGIWLRQIAPQKQAMLFKIQPVSELSSLLLSTKFCEWNDKVVHLCDDHSKICTMLSTLPPHHHSGLNQSVRYTNYHLKFNQEISDDKTSRWLWWDSVDLDNNTADETRA